MNERQQRIAPRKLQPAGALSVAITALEHEQAQLESELGSSASALEQARHARIAADSGAVGACQNMEQATAQRDAAVGRWQQALKKSSYASIEEFSAALLTAEEQAELDRQWRAYQDALLLARNTLQEKQAAIAGLERPELAGFEEAEQGTRALRDQAIGHFGALGEQHKNQSQVLNKLATLAKEQATLEAEYAVTGKLSQVANGSNAYRLSLQRFVLAALLDDVLIEADHRLEAHEQGPLPPAAAPGGGRYARQIRARSRCGGRLHRHPRSVATLSGGESFMAALSLALGLSDVVQAHSGGIRLDTLFIDEGFGSLDPDSLDLAIRTLLDLQAAGRMVGIISHVPELKQQIAAQVVVEAGVSGSRVRVVGE